MAKRESTLTNMLLTLFIITLVSAAILGYVYGLTAKPIGNALERKTIKAVELVLPEFNGNPQKELFKVEGTEGLDSVEIYPARKDDKLIGMAVKAKTLIGFSGLVCVMVGFDAEGKIYDTFVLEHKETPGLGTKMSDPNFKNQFKGKNPAVFKMRVKKDKGDVDAITAATISSRAFCDALNNAHEAYKKAVEKLKAKN